MRYSRRKLLKSIGASSVIGSIAGKQRVGESGRVSEFRQKIKKGLKKRKKADERAQKIGRGIRRNGGSNERIQSVREQLPHRTWKKFLTSNNMAFETKKLFIRFDGPESPGFRNEPAGIPLMKENPMALDPGLQPYSVNNVDTSGVDITISLVTEDYSEYYVDIAFKLYFDVDPSGHTCYNESSGEPPLDTGGIGWKNACWAYAYEDLGVTTGTSEYVSYTDDTYSLDSMGFEIDDDAMFTDWYEDNTDCDMTATGGSGYSGQEYYGVYLDTTSGDDNCNGDDDTYILGSYSHTYEGTYGSFSVGVSYPLGISISYGQTSNLIEETTTTEDDGSTPLRISKDEATYYDPCSSNGCFS